MDKKIEKKKWLPKKYRPLILLALFVFLVSVVALAMTQTSVYRIDKDRLIIAEVREDAFQDFIYIRARAEPVYMAYLDAVEGGIVEQIFHEEGAMVEKGDTLLELSNLNLSLNILNSEAQLAEKANFLRETQLSMEQQKLNLERELVRLDYELIKTERDYSQQKGLFENEHISKNAFLATKEALELSKKLKKLSLEQQKRDGAFRKTQIQKIKQNLSSMERNLDLIYKRQEHLLVKAPVSGQVASLNAVPGQSISTGYRLGQINVLSAFKLVASIDEHYIDRVQTELTAKLELGSKTYSCMVSKIYPEVSGGQFQVELLFEGEVPKNIRSGQTYNLDLNLGETEEATLLRRGGFFQSSGGRYVYLLDETETKAIRQPINIGRQNPDYYEVKTGLKAGDKVVISNYELFGNSEALQFK
jgi:HlyD family secretion protein